MIIKTIALLLASTFIYTNSAEAGKDKIGNLAVGQQTTFDLNILGDYRYYEKLHYWMDQWGDVYAISQRDGFKIVSEDEKEVFLNTMTPSQQMIIPEDNSMAIFTGVFSVNAFDLKSFTSNKLKLADQNSYPDSFKPEHTLVNYLGKKTLVRIEVRPKTDKIEVVLVDLDNKTITKRFNVQHGYLNLRSRSIAKIVAFEENEELIVTVVFNRDSGPAYALTVNATTEKTLSQNERASCHLQNISNEVIELNRKKYLAVPTQGGCVYPGDDNFSGLQSGIALIDVKDFSVIDHFEFHPHDCVGSCIKEIFKLNSNDSKKLVFNAGNYFSYVLNLDSKEVSQRPKIDDYVRDSDGNMIALSADYPSGKATAYNVKDGSLILEEKSRHGGHFKLYKFRDRIFFYQEFHKRDEVKATFKRIL